ncbi:hypothetical protein PHLGIDRAFT_11937 [Phlebiopsis gigantea 11061_1 CR5-6]|uniref:Major facilitator superfamily (MFS) profile domain-containing protein n=1 Tax=Phlebiopsis gigantea (strain 11061_1 CR5-6) TaxID=745531 RepID=A0A0C3PQK5_PHLG1|nr:hypothetical protein PHLGIDRAFT_11937 [Phlebiopsis gigantea 11061_1 CR5-6]
MPTHAHNAQHDPRDVPSPTSSSEKAGSFRHSEGSLDQDKAADAFRTHVVARSVSSETPLGADAVLPAGAYRLYRRRFVGLLALIALNVVAAMPNPWFGPIATNTANEFGFTLDEVNWFGNVVNLAFLPSTIVVPFILTRYGILKTPSCASQCCSGAVVMLFSAWIRYAGTAESLPEGGAYALITLGQILAGAAQPVFQVLGPLYSETWFDLKGRTTATMLMSIANPVGSGIAQLISPTISTPRSSLLVLAIICTATAPCALLVGNAPPTPPTFAASQDKPSFLSLVRALSGREPSNVPTYMSVRERIDFVILVINFGVLVGVVTSFTILTDQDFGPYGYSSDTSGFMGATLLLAGIVAAVVTSPLFDRVLTHHLALTCKVLCPILGVVWLSLIWAARPVKPNDAGALYALMALVGAASVTLLPVAIELTIEVSRNADGSSALLWFAGNLMSVVCVLVEGALRAGPAAHPPNNMHRALVFQGALVCGAVATIAGLRGRQARRARDEQMAAEARQGIALVEHGSP